MSFDASATRREFPMLDGRRSGVPLVYLDSAGTTLRPRCVIERMARFEQSENSALDAADGSNASALYEDARRRVARFIGANEASEVVFCRGATEAINLVAQTWGEQNVGPGDEILVTQLEHHANLAPWHALGRRRGATLRTVPVDEAGNLSLAGFHERLGKRTKLVAVAHASNVLGTIVPLREIVAAARAVGACVLVDGAQAPAHLSVDVRGLDVDFYTFSAHKAFGPPGIGVLFGKRTVLESMPAWQLGANAIEEFDDTSCRYARPPARFEAGSANIAGAVGMAAALDFIDAVGIATIREHESKLFAQLLEGMHRLRNLRLLGAARARIPLLSFCATRIGAADLRQALARQGVEARSGHLSAQPLLTRFGVSEAVRVSLAAYNSAADVAHTLEMLERILAAG
jgi:cysteine desulfurase/selenocysteine lyase